MCGRYSITSPAEAIQRVFEVPERPNLPPRYNVAPTQEVPAVRLGEDGKRHLVLLRWGLIPFWAEDAAIGSRLINARSESAADKPAFRSAFRKRRCLVVADGFYEWRKAVRKGERKQPYRITRADGEPFAFAGLWERWIDPSERTPIESCTILTTDANERIAELHPRMPVILDRTDFDAWLDPRREPSEVRTLLRPYPPEELEAYAISTRINNVANDDPGVIEPADGGGESQPQLL